MNIDSLRDFLDILRNRGALHQIDVRVDTNLEITEISRQALESDPNSPALLFAKPVTGEVQHTIPILTNLFASFDRILLALGYTQKTADVKKGHFSSINGRYSLTIDQCDYLRAIGKKFASLRYLTPPRTFSEARIFVQTALSGLSSLPKTPYFSSFSSLKLHIPGFTAPCQEVVFKGKDVNLDLLPIQRCWRLDAAPLISWGCVVTATPADLNTSARDMNSIDWRHNIGVYRMQKLSSNKLIVRWLKHRGGAQHFCSWQNKQKSRMPIAVFIGADPRTVLAAAIPAPEDVSEYALSGLLSGKRLRLTKCVTIPLFVPANAEIVLEGYIDLDTSQYKDEGPFGDHTGFYNTVEKFPVMEVTAMTMRRNPIYLSTYTGKPPDEPSILGEAFNEMLIPILQKQFPEIIDFYLPPECCSYRVAVVSISKQYPGHAKRIMLGIWSFLRQFLYTKFIIVVDFDVNVRNWQEVMWILSTHMDFARDAISIPNMPIDYLDFASTESDLGGKMGFDATKKIGVETQRQWGEKIEFDADVAASVKAKWSEYGFLKPLRER